MCNESTALSADTNLSIQDFYYRFTPIGEVIPCVTISPLLKIKEHGYLRDIPLLHPRGSASIARGDIVSVETAPSHETLIHMVSRNNITRHSLSQRTCPVCGQPLLPSEIGIGRCINYTCKAYLLSNTLHLLKVIGVCCDNVVEDLIQHLINIGGISNPVDVFMLNFEVLATTTDREILRQLQSDIQFARGRVRLADVLYALNIPQFTREDALDIESYVNTNITSNSIGELITLACQVEIPIWQEFISLKTNYNSLVELLDALVRHW